MSEESLPSSLQEFRRFIYDHPLLIREVREGRRTWNDLYQDWIVLGEEHDDWKNYKDTKEDKSSPVTEQGDSLGTVMKMLSQVNIQELQQQMSQFSGMIGNVQRLLQQFQKPPGPPKPPQDPFSFRGF
ncbi:spore coat protein YlbD [Alteribacillus iranensis]|uniref:Putative coat protein n=1 Tax=Alteribacillus iranensis TaxID=930128 RepID=A0A1I2ADL9_9BACI|nr:spore coat protein YlbD [Alteribacillus iranensis]SFE41996.1 Putative coat protein [Alteribacillus iranensis]